MTNNMARSEYNRSKLLHIKLKSLAFLFVFFTIAFMPRFTQVVYAASLQDLIDQDIINPANINLDNFGQFFSGNDPLLDITIGGESVAATSTVQVIFLFTLIALAPSLLIMVTSFTRIIIVMHFIRSALGTQQMPPNQILVGLALFLTFFIMSRHFTDAYQNAFVPYSAGEITQAEALELGIEPFREFMIYNAGYDNLAFFAALVGEQYAEPSEIPLSVIIPAFIVTEITVGFMMGFFIFIPFIVIDMVVASVLMAMGMMMLPPAMISTPFKILLFILVDGWTLIVDLLVQTFVITR